LHLFLKASCGLTGKKTLPLTTIHHLAIINFNLFVFLQKKVGMRGKEINFVCPGHFLLLPTNIHLESCNDWNVFWVENQHRNFQSMKCLLCEEKSMTLGRFFFEKKGVTFIHPDHSWLHISRRSSDSTISLAGNKVGFYIYTTCRCSSEKKTLGKCKWIFYHLLSIQ